MSDEAMEAAWRKRFPGVARAPLYDKGWTDARQANAYTTEQFRAGVDAMVAHRDDVALRDVGGFERMLLGHALRAMGFVREESDEKKVLVEVQKELAEVRRANARNVAAHMTAERELRNLRERIEALANLWDRHDYQQVECIQAATTLRAALEARK